LENQIRIIYEDDDLLALYKPNGILVEGVSSGEGTLSDWVKSQYHPGVRALHRIDRDTTGLVLFAKNSKWNREFSEMFEKKRIRKEYWVIVNGNWDSRISKVESMIRRTEDGKWENSSQQGKDAKTTFRVLGKSGSYTWLQALPKSGRTHQLRLHCLKAGYPIIGDRFYSDDSTNPFLLHARALALKHPANEREIQVKADPPEFWQRWLRPFTDNLP